MAAAVPRAHLGGGWVPLEAPVIMAMLELASCCATDNVWDLGCGDARALHMAVRSPFSAAAATGIELDPEVAARAATARAEGALAGSEANVIARIIVGDAADEELLTGTGISEATLVVLFVTPGLLGALAPLLRKLCSPACRVIAATHSFDAAWQPGPGGGSVAARGPVDDGAAYGGMVDGAVYGGMVDGAVYGGMVDGAVYGGMVDGAVYGGMVDGAGNLALQSDLGFRYARGDVVVQDQAEALRLYTLAAGQGFAGAQFNLGTCYMTGNGVAHDEVKAARRVRKAAKQGLADAQLSLGYLCECGKGTKRDLGEAVRLYCAAASQRNVWALVRLGVCLEKGRDVAQSEADATASYAAASELDGAEEFDLALAARLGHAGAVEKLALISGLRELPCCKQWRDEGDPER
ncbi:hypothetical protein T492DRAFT_910094 [Pavlovales sp. CCMP2436]|nr:hypothetical protein T492DRAFT_910094 [Pavlovales sp. CCMP2436]